MNYADFIDRKTHLGGEFGFEPTFIPDAAFDFQRHIIEWSVRKGRAAVFADCGPTIRLDASGSRMPRPV